MGTNKGAVSSQFKEVEIRSVASACEVSEEGGIRGELIAPATIPTRQPFVRRFCPPPIYFDRNSSEDTPIPNAKIDGQDWLLRQDYTAARTETREP